MKKLLHDGESSDLTLVCEGKEVKVHQLIVCAHSPVIKKAVTGEFKEATSKVLNVDFGIDALNLMLTFIYSGRYYPEVGYYRPQGSKSLSPAQSDTNRKYTLLNIKVNGIADYYDVAFLTGLTRDIICDMAAGKFVDFMIIYKAIYVDKLTGDTAIAPMLARIAAETPGMLARIAAETPGILPSSRAKLDHLTPDFWEAYWIRLASKFQDEEEAGNSSYRQWSTKNPDI